MPVVSPSRRWMAPNPVEARVTTLELFFDLVFVFALTQVTALIAADLTGRGVVRGLLVLGLLWWSWVAYAWLGNVVRADLGITRAALLAAMAIMFLVALAIPEGFDDLAGGLPGPVVVAACYFGFRLIHLLLFWALSAADPGLRRQVRRFTPSMVGGTLLLLVASRFSGGTQTLLWALALLADYGGTWIGGAGGWRLPSPGHFAERHGLIVIIALGESIVAIGVGVAALPVSWPIVAASVVGLALASALWWAYFDISALQGERALLAEPEPTRPRLARDAYSYLHFPMLVGVALLAVGLKKVLEQVGDAAEHRLTEPLTGYGLYALYGGVVIYLLAHVGFKWRTARHLSRPRLVAAGLLVALVPAVATIPVLHAVTLEALVMVALIGYETVRFAEHRARLRDHSGPAKAGAP
ncbi:MAG: low temperature requirement protein A [Actinomycetota bacterium]